MKIFHKILLIINIILFALLLYLNISTVKYVDNQRYFNNSLAIDFESYQENNNTYDIHLNRDASNDSEIIAHITFEEVKTYIDSSHEINKLKNSGFNITINKEALKELEEFWSNNEKNEFGVCLEGYVKRRNNFTTYIITDITDFKKGDNSSIKSLFCPFKLGTLHSHPMHTETWSKDDKAAFEKYVKYYKNKVMLIMTDKNRIVAYDTSSIKSGEKSIFEAL